MEVLKTDDRKTSVNEKIVQLRKALFSDDGKDKDVTNGIAMSFLKFDRSDRNFDIQFTPRLNDVEMKFAFDLIKCTMEEIYDTSGYGWNDEDKVRDLTEEGSRFLIVREQIQNNSSEGRLVAFTHFKFTVQGEIRNQMMGKTSLHIQDIHVAKPYQRLGLGRNLLILMELIARREKIKTISIPIQLKHQNAVNWIGSVGRGYAPDESLLQLLGFDSTLSGFEVYSKLLAPSPIPSREASPEPSPETSPVNSNKTVGRIESNPSPESNLNPNPIHSIGESASEIKQIFFNISANASNTIPSNSSTIEAKENTKRDACKYCISNESNDNSSHNSNDSKNRNSNDNSNSDNSSNNRGTYVSTKNNNSGDDTNPNPNPTATNLPISSSPNPNIRPSPSANSNNPCPAPPSSPSQLPHKTLSLPKNSRNISSNLIPKPFTKANFNSNPNYNSNTFSPNPRSPSSNPNPNVSPTISTITKRNTSMNSNTYPPSIKSTIPLSPRDKLTPQSMPLKKTVRSNSNPNLPISLAVWQTLTCSPPPSPRIKSSNPNSLTQTLNSNHNGQTLSSFTLSPPPALSLDNPLNSPNPNPSPSPNKPHRPPSDEDWVVITSLDSNPNPTNLTPNLTLNPKYNTNSINKKDETDNFYQDPLADGVEERKGISCSPFQKRNNCHPKISKVQYVS